MMDADVVAVTEQVTKKYCRSLRRSLWYGARDLAAEFTGRAAPPRADLRQGEFLALDDVDLELRRGECLGVVGANGAGKSTLLKLLNGLMRPDGGCIRVRGRVGGLIELGAGFNPLLTGRENIYVNGAIFGIPRRQMDRQLEEIVEFAQLAPYIDAPLRSYSSGMRARLGFSVAVSARPDVLLVDEVLAVGDAAFRARCHRRLSELLGQGSAVMLVSHNAQMLLATCTGGVLLEAGRVTCRGAMPEVLRRYESTLLPSAITHSGHGWRATPDPEIDAAEARIIAVDLQDDRGEPVTALHTGAAGYIRVRCRARRRLDPVHMGVIVRAPGMGEESMLFLSSKVDSVSFALARGESDLRLRLDPVALRPGFYSAKITLQAPPFATLDRVDDFHFRVEGGNELGPSSFHQPHAWEPASATRADDDFPGAA